MPKIPKNPKNKYPNADYSYPNKDDVIARMNSQAKTEAIKAKARRLLGGTLKGIQDFVGIHPGESIFSKVSQDRKAQEEQYKRLRKEMGWN